jgi:hypothetical protein
VSWLERVKSDQILHLFILSGRSFIVFYYLFVQHLSHQEIEEEMVTFKIYVICIILIIDNI